MFADSRRIPPFTEFDSKRQAALAPIIRPFRITRAGIVESGYFAAIDHGFRLLREDIVYQVEIELAPAGRIPAGSLAALFRTLKNVNCDGFAPRFPVSITITN